MFFIINSFMKNPREYTNKDPLVKAVHAVLAADKATKLAEKKAALEEAVKPKGGFEFTVDIGGIDYKTQLDRVVKLIKKTRILKSDKDITSFLESGFGRELGEIIVGQHARLSPAARKNDAPLTSFLSKKLPIWDAMEESTKLEQMALWAEGALSLPNEKELAMAITQLNFLCHASMEIRNHLMNGGGFPEWFQNKLSGLHNSMEDLHSYMAGKEEIESNE